MIRFFDFLFSLLGLLILFPVFVIIYILIVLDSRGGGLYIQNRVGKDGIDFSIFKFRSMRKGSDKNGLITIGGRDPRLTNIGAFIRRFKLDELPQLFNVLKGDMSLVGPRPEVRRYVDLYTPLQQRVLRIKPGITDYASIEYVDENIMLGSAENPEEVYIEKIMPDKIRLNMKYVQNQSLRKYFHIIYVTLWRIIKKPGN